MRSDDRWCACKFTAQRPRWASPDRRGNFELNVFKPVIIYNFLHSVTLITDACHGYVEYMIKGIEVDRAKDRLATLRIR